MMNKENTSLPQYVDHYSRTKLIQAKRAFTRQRILSDLDVNLFDKPQSCSTFKHQRLTPNLFLPSGAKPSENNDNQLVTIKKRPACGCLSRQEKQWKVSEVATMPNARATTVTDHRNAFHLRNSINMHVVAFNMKSSNALRVQKASEYPTLRMLEEMIKHASKITLSTRYYKILNSGDKTQCSSAFSLSFLKEIIHINCSRKSKYLVSRNFLANYNYTPNIRNQVINWIYNLMNFLGVESHVIFSTVRLFDYILSTIYVHEDLLQLVALVLFWISHKLDNDRTPFLASTLATFCNNVYTKYNILDMEMKLLKALNYELFMEDIVIYIEYYVVISPHHEKGFLSRCAKYLLECYMFSTDFTVIMDYYLAVVAVKLSIDILYGSRRDWSDLAYMRLNVDLNLATTIETRMHNQVVRMQHDDFKFREPIAKYSTAEKGRVSQFVKHQLNLINKS